MNSRTIFRIATAVALITGSALVSAQVQMLPSSPKLGFGASVTPAYDGWYDNPDGTHSFLIGYYNRNWSQEVSLEGGKVQRLDYARLIPATLTPTITQTYANAPTDISQSADRRFVSFIFADRPNVLLFYDLTKPDQAAKEVVVGKALLSNPAKLGSLIVSEWTEDGKIVLVENIVSGVVQDYLLINRDDGASTKNLTTTLNQKDVVISLCYCRRKCCRY